MASGFFYASRHVLHNLEKQLIDGCWNTGLSTELDYLAIQVWGFRLSSAQVQILPRRGIVIEIRVAGERLCLRRLTKFGDIVPDRGPSGEWLVPDAGCIKHSQSFLPHSNQQRPPVRRVPDFQY